MNSKIKARRMVNKNLIGQQLFGNKYESLTYMQKSVVNRNLKSTSGELEKKSKYSASYLNEFDKARTRFRKEIEI